MNPNPTDDSVHHTPAANGLALVRVTIGAMFVWVFFENLGKGLYTPGGYAGLIHYYIEKGHSPAVWKAVMASGGEPCRDGSSDAGDGRDLVRRAARHRSVHAPRGFCSVPVPRQPLDVGVGHGMDLGTAGSCPRIAGARDRTRRPSLGRRRLAGAALAERPVVVDLSQDPVRVSVIIPTHNEAQAIGRVLADLPADLVTEVLVVDSNSTDGTAEIAETMGARVLREPRRGYGRACLTGLAASQCSRRRRVPRRRLQRSAR